MDRARENDLPPRSGLDLDRPTDRPFGLVVAAQGSERHGTAGQDGGIVGSDRNRGVPEVKGQWPGRPSRCRASPALAMCWRLRVVIGQLSVVRCSLSRVADPGVQGRAALAFVCDRQGSRQHIVSTGL